MTTKGQRKTTRMTKKHESLVWAARLHGEFVRFGRVMGYAYAVEGAQGYGAIDISREPVYQNIPDPRSHQLAEESMATIPWHRRTELKIASITDEVEMEISNKPVLRGVTHFTRVTENMGGLVKFWRRELKASRRSE